ncbi:MAG: DUF3857 domain-containing protein [Flavobacteriaceae bacterium]
MKKRLLVIILLIVIAQIGVAQNYKFGKVSKEELEEKYYPLDSSAHAAVLYKKRKTSFNYLQGEGFILETEIHERIKIYDKEGYKWATKRIFYYNPDSDDSQSVKVKGAKTYHLVAGKVKSIELGKKDVFKEASTEYWSQKKFTMPNLDEGCIVEWKYVLTSPYRIIDNVVLQYDIPVKKLVVSIEIPEYYKFAVKHIGYLNIHSTTSKKRKSINFVDKQRSSSFMVAPAKTTFTSSQVDYTINITTISQENIPAFIEEPFINYAGNYKAAIDYELASTEWPNQLRKYFSKTWEDVAETIYDNPNFGVELHRTSHLKDDIAVLKTDLKSEVEKIYGSLNYVKSIIKWNDNYGKYTEKGLRKAFKEGSGNIGDINLTLVAVLRELGLNANPVLVSTRSNGVPTFPTLSGFNYVIAVVETSQGNILLDASEKYSLPNVLPLRVINWNGAIVRENKTIDFADLSSLNVAIQDSNLSYKIDKEGFIEGMNRTKYSNLLAINYRNQKGGKDQDDVISDIEVENDDIEILNFRVSNVDDLSKPVVEMYKFEKEDGAELIADKMYIIPLLFLATDENPFKLDNREYPIDFGTPWQDKIIVSIQIPEGYKIESVPEDMAIGLRDDLGKFIYSVKISGNKIKVTSFFEINSGVISATYYAELKGLFKKLVAKQTEKIVLVKEQ